MSVIVKIRPVTLRQDGMLVVPSIWNYGNQVLENGDEAFVWFTREGVAGLAMQGTLGHIAPAGISGNNRPLVSLEINITGANPVRPFTIAALRPHNGSTESGPLPTLARKLLGNSHQKVILLDEGEAQHLRTFFASQTAGLSAQDWRSIEGDAALAAHSRIGARIRRDIGNDLASSAMEGLTEEQRRTLRSRAAWLAGRFVRQRELAGDLRCNHCNFDLGPRVQDTRVNP